MTETAYFKTTSGVIYKIDVPDGGNLREIHDEKIAKGLLTPVDGPVVEVERADGSTWYELKSAKKPSRGKKTKEETESKEVPDVEDEFEVSDVEESQTEE